MFVRLIHQYHLIIHQCHLNGGIGTIISLEIAEETVNAGLKIPILKIILIGPLVTFLKNGMELVTFRQFSFK